MPPADGDVIAATAAAAAAEFSAACLPARPHLQVCQLLLSHHCTRLTRLHSIQQAEASSKQQAANTLHLGGNGHRKEGEEEGRQAGRREERSVANTSASNDDAKKW
jgi:hypothetical protein